MKTLHIDRTLHIHRSPGIREHLTLDVRGRLRTDIFQDPVPVLAEAQHVRHAQEVRTKQELAGCVVKAVIPMGVYAQSVAENWDKKRWNQWLQDPANRSLVIDGKHKR